MLQTGSQRTHRENLSQREVRLQILRKSVRTLSWKRRHFDWDIFLIGLHEFPEWFIKTFHNFTCIFKHCSPI